ncbi:MAG TPA: hypothetical protein VFJ58_24530 [Armatimonadota bacterium]|nr:hypothetical protein [Armatimonadota bacterium]
MPEMVDVSLASPDVSVEPGASVEIEALVRNHSAAADSAALEVEFAEPTWIAIPVAGVTLEPGQSRPVRILFKIPPASGAPTGDYPFVVRVRSLETGASAFAQGSLHVKPYHAFTLEIAPPRSDTNPFDRRTQYDLTLVNQGNAPDTYDLNASDPENACVYELPGGRVEVAPGESLEIPLTVAPRRRPMVANHRLYGFQVKAKPHSGSSPAESVYAQIEYRPFCSPLIALLLLIAAAYGGWYLFQRTNGPEITQFEARPASIVAGQPTTLLYALSHVNSTSHLHLKNGTINEVYELDLNSNNKVVQPDTTTQYTLMVEDDSGRKSERRVTVTVHPAAAAPPPVISSFNAAPASLNFGESTLLTWRVTGAKSLFLEPIDKQLDPALTSIQDTPRQTITYTLVAENRDGVPTKKTVKVIVIPPPKPDAPQISFFSATPPRIHAGDPVTLSWNVSGAASVIIPGVGAVDSAGSRTFQPERSTQFSLVAIGPSGLQSEKSVGVQIIRPPKILSFTAHPATIRPGDQAELAWSVHNADQVSIVGIGPVDREGILNVKPTSTTTYTLKATDASGHDTEQTVAVTVTPAQ